MHQLIREFLDARQAISDAHVAADLAEKRARSPKRVPMPKRLRPAVASDIVEGAVIWYPRFRHEDDPNEDASAGWMVVEEPLHYGDDWKAYTAHDGCRYGLHEAFVEMSRPARKRAKQ